MRQPPIQPNISPSPSGLIGGKHGRKRNAQEECRDPKTERGERAARRTGDDPGQRRASLEPERKADFPPPSFLLSCLPPSTLSFSPSSFNFSFFGASRGSWYFFILKKLQQGSQLLEYAVSRKHKEFIIYFPNKAIIRSLLITNTMFSAALSR